MPRAPDEPRTDRPAHSLRAIKNNCLNHVAIDEDHAKRLGYPSALAQIKANLRSIADLCDQILGSPEPGPGLSGIPDPRIDRAVDLLTSALRAPGLLSPDPIVATMLLTIIGAKARDAMTSIFKEK